MTEKHFNKLSPASAERIAMLMEEAGEVVQICGKILRHGLHNHHPASTTENRFLLRSEIMDFMAAAHACRNKEIESRQACHSSWDDGSGKTNTCPDRQHEVV